MLQKTAIALALLAYQPHAGGNSHEAIQFGVPYICNLAAVDNVLPGARLEVRSRPSKRAHRIDQLKPGAFVYICDETAGWDKIYYGDEAKRCGPALPTAGLDVRQARDCKSGWVIDKWITVISG